MGQLMRRRQILQGVAGHYQGAAPLARAIRAELDKAGIHAVLESDVPSIIATRHAAADIEYVLAVNATNDEESGKNNAVKAATATLSLPADGRPVYDVIRGGADRTFSGRPAN